MGLIQKKNDREEVDGIEIIGRGDTPGDIDENEVELVEGTSAEHMAAGTTAEKEAERAERKMAEDAADENLSLIHISEPTRPTRASRMPSSA